MTHRPKFPLDFFEPIVEPFCADPVVQLVCKRCGAFSTNGSVDENAQDLFYNPELMEDPDNRPYIWDLPEGDCKCH